MFRKMTTLIKIADFILIVIVLAVIGFQIYHSQVNNLSQWKGGGFGMYADPHPASHRTVWLEGIKNGRNRKIRIFPEGPVLDNEALSFEIKQASRRAFHDVWKSIYYPETYNWDRLNHKIRALISTYSRDSLISTIPDSLAHFVVYESQISPDYRRLTVNPIFTKEFE